MKIPRPINFGCNYRAKCAIKYKRKRRERNTNINFTRFPLPDHSSSHRIILQHNKAHHIAPQNEHVCLFLIIAVVAVKIHQQRQTCNKSISCLVMRHGSKRATRTVEMGYTIHQPNEHQQPTMPTTTSTKPKDRV